MFFIYILNKIFEDNLKILDHITHRKIRKVTIDYFVDRRGRPAALEKKLFMKKKTKQYISLGWSAYSRQL